MTIADGSTILTAAELSNAAYWDDALSLNPSGSTRGLLEADGLSSWTALTQVSVSMPELPPEFSSLPTASLTGPGIDEHGYYVNGPDAAYVAKSTDGTLALVFRGSDQLPVDQLDAYLGASTDYAGLEPLIGAFISYANNAANGVKRIIVTGHSLGGELATLFASSIISGTHDINDLSIDPSKIDVVTFGSPGIKREDYSDHLGDSSITNIVHTQDPVGTDAIVVSPLDMSDFVHPGTTVRVDLPATDPAVDGITGVGSDWRSTRGSRVRMLLRVTNGIFIPPAVHGRMIRFWMLIRRT